VKLLYRLCLYGIFVYPDVDVKNIRNQQHKTIPIQTKINNLYFECTVRALQYYTYTPSTQHTNRINWKNFIPEIIFEFNMILFFNNIKSLQNNVFYWYHFWNVYISKGQYIFNFILPKHNIYFPEYFDIKTFNFKRIIN